MMGTEKELTISQALRKIKDLKGKIARHSQNATTSVTHRTDSPPAYSFGAEWEKATALVDEMLDVQTRVAIANAKSTFDYEGKTRTLVWATKKLVEIKGAIAWHSGLDVRAHEKTTDESFDWVQKVGGGAERVRVSVEYACHLPEAEKSARIQALETKFVELNDFVETMNHRTTV
jgi:hypothetical protein